MCSSPAATSSRRPLRESRHSWMLCVTTYWEMLRSFRLWKRILRRGSIGNRPITSCTLDAFFHRRAEIRAELEDGGLEVVAQVPIEGLRFLAQDFDALWTDSTKRSRLLDLLTRAEAIEEVNGASAHHITVGRKP